MTDEKRLNCPGCDDELTRREFTKVVGGLALAGGLAPVFTPSRADAAPTPNSAAETVVKELYTSLTDSQKKTICFPWNHEKQHRISANWNITEPAIEDDFYTVEQRKMIEDIFKGVTSDDGFERFKRQMRDDYGGFGEYRIAIFGEPGTGKFQWELTGRHLTMRADGDSVENMAFGGPIVYGHGASDPKKNLFHYQTQKANEVFAALDPKQREQALLAKAPRESDVPLQGKSGEFPGISVGDLSSDQQELFESVVKVILSPYRPEDVEEALLYIKKAGGLKQLNMAFYEAGDLNNDKVWDIWRVEGPSFVWHFRGAPHVHTYVNIGLKKA
jgi:hypothetical protein